MPAPPAPTAEPYFHLLCVSADPVWAEAICAEARSLRGCRTTATARGFEPGETGARATVARENIEARKSSGCLLCVADFSRPATTQEFMTRAADAEASELSPHMILLAAVDAEIAFAFAEFVNVLAHNVARVGTRAAVSSALASLVERAANPPWPAPGWAGTVSMRNLNVAVSHDYLVNGVMNIILLPRVRAEGLLREQVEIDFLNQSFVNVLIEPTRLVDQRKCRKLGEEPGIEPDLVRRIHATEACFVVPDQFADGLRRSGLYFVAWSTAAQVPELVRQQAAAGRGPIVVGPAAEILDLDFGTAAAPPLILVGEPEHRANWHEWPRLLARNVLGSFSEPTFFAILPDKYELWKTFTVIPLAAAVNRMIELILFTRERLAQADWAGDEQDRSKYLSKIATVGAQMMSLRDRYFPPAMPSDWRL